MQKRPAYDIHFDNAFKPHISNTGFYYMWHGGYVDKVQSDFFCILRLSFASNASMNLEMSKGIMLTANWEQMKLKQQQ